MYSRRRGPMMSLPNLLTMLVVNYSTYVRRRRLSHHTRVDIKTGTALHQCPLYLRFHSSLHSLLSRTSSEESCNGYTAFMLLGDNLFSPVPPHFWTPCGPGVFR
jgi:hypothetical protein